MLENTTKQGPLKAFRIVYALAPWKQDTCGYVFGPSLEEAQSRFERNCRHYEPDTVIYDVAEIPAEVVTAHEPMIAHHYADGKHTRLTIEPRDLENLITRSGWTIVDTLEYVGPVGRAELARLESLPYIGPSWGGLDWWLERVIDVTPCGLTPDQ